MLSTVWFLEKSIQRIGMCRHTHIFNTYIFLYISFFVVPTSFLLLKLSLQFKGWDPWCQSLTRHQTSWRRHSETAHSMDQDPKNKQNLNYSSSASPWGYFKSKIRVHSLNILPKKECCPATMKTMFWKEVAAGQINPVSALFPCVSRSYCKASGSLADRSSSQIKSRQEFPEKAVRQTALL